MQDQIGDGVARSLPSRVSRTIPLRREGGRLSGLTQINGRGSAARKGHRIQNPAYTSLGVIFLTVVPASAGNLGNSCFYRPYIYRSANLAHCAVAAAGGAVFAPVEDDAEVELIPLFLGEELFEVGFGLGNAFAAAETPAFGEAVDMGIHGECGHAKGLRHDYAGRLVAHTWERFQFREGLRDSPCVALAEDL